MNNKPCEELQTLVASDKTLDDPRRLRAMLNDLCGEYKLENNAIADAIDAGVVGPLRSSATAQPELLLPQLVQRMREERGTAEDVAR